MSYDILEIMLKRKELDIKGKVRIINDLLKANEEESAVNYKLKNEIDKLSIEKDELIKAGNEFRHHMNTTIDKLQKEAQR